jgi:transposase
LQYNTKLIILELYMGRKVTLELAIEDRSRLQSIVSRGENWRERERAQTLILLDDGLSLSQTADKVGIHVRTVGFTRLDWLARRFESLVDKPRSGAPQKISPEQLSRVLDAARSEPLTAKALLAKHLDEGGTLVHLNTLTGALKAAGVVWKRTRHSLKKKERD